MTSEGSGIGREIVLLLLKKGASVAAVDIDEAPLKETVKLAGDHPAELSILMVDITEREAVFTLADAVVKTFGAIDAIINNAGIIQRFVRINDLDFQEIEHIFDVNF